MKFTSSFVIGLIIGLASLNLQAFSNPQIRICNQKQGQFIAAPLGEDNIGLCKFKNSIVGTIDLLRLIDDKSDDKSVQSLSNYKNRELNCSAQVVEMVISDEGATQSFCLYEDGSLIDIETLNSGRDDSANKALNSALGF